MKRRSRPADQTSKLEFESEVLEAMYTTGTTSTSTGDERRLHSSISPRMSSALYRAVRRTRPKIAVEIGMAYGASTLAILTALRDNAEQAMLFSIDPSQGSYWESAGSANVHRAGLSDLHMLIEEPDYLALPNLILREQRIQLAYIDGWHTFDHVLLDAFYVDKILDPGGLVGFNDCGWPAVHKAIKFLHGHRRYQEYNVGLNSSFDGKSLIQRLSARAVGRPSQDRYFLKEENWEPNWDFYAKF